MKDEYIIPHDRLIIPGLKVTLSTFCKIKLSNSRFSASTGGGIDFWVLKQISLPKKICLVTKMFFYMI